MSPEEFAIREKIILDLTKGMNGEEIKKLFSKHIPDCDYRLELFHLTEYVGKDFLESITDLVKQYIKRHNIETD